MYWYKNHPTFAARDRDGNNIRLGDINGQLKALLKEYNHLPSPSNRKRNRNKRLSNRRQHVRALSLSQFMRELRQPQNEVFRGMRIQSLARLKLRHADYLADFWFSKGLKGGVIRDYISMLRALYDWVGKHHVVPDNRQWLTPERYDYISRCVVAMTDKSMQGGGFSDEQVFALINRVENYSPRVAAAIRLQFVFGLRVKESLLFRPFEDVRAETLHLRHGCKNGRPRQVPVETEFQREALDRIKLAMAERDRCLVPHEGKYQKMKNHYYYIIRQYAPELRRAHRTSHSFRHSYLIRQYEKKSGRIAPVRGGVGAADPVDESRVKQATAELGGHSRPESTSAYTGSADAHLTPGQRRQIAAQARAAVDGMTTREQIALIARVQPGHGSRPSPNPHA